ncbi:MAG: hypothetical protein DI543_02955 [Bradyrhizobium icense]|jgi:hypothetical protein|nr:MAG: hypothetical protein DI543_02955 [Bradyrhizobium icense]
MSSVINFVEFEHQIVLATYRHLMVGATVVLIDNDNGEALPEPVVRIASPAPAGSVRLRLPATVKPGSYCLRAINGHGEHIAQSLPFRVG